jgi:hypothetical protein
MKLARYKLTEINSINLFRCLTTAGELIIIIILPEMDEVKGGWRKLHDEDLYNIYSL